MAIDATGNLIRLELIVLPSSFCAELKTAVAQISVVRDPPVDPHQRPLCNSGCALAKSRRVLRPDNRYRLPQSALTRSPSVRAAYLETMRFGGGAADVGAAGDIDRVSHAFQPSGRCSAPNSL